MLVHWCDKQTSSATWEDLDDFRSRFPDFQLEDELDLEGGGEMSCADAPTPSTSAPATCAEQKSVRYARALRCARAGLLQIDRIIICFKFLELRRIFGGLVVRKDKIAIPRIKE